MPKVRQKEIEDGAIDAQRMDETDDFTWTGTHDFSGGTVNIADATSADEPLSLGQYQIQAYHPPVDVRAQANVNISAPGSTIDGESMSLGDRVMCDSQTVTSQDGCYVWQGAAVPMVRSDDFPTGLAISTHIFGVLKGTDAGGLFAFINASGTDIIGTDDLIVLSFASEINNVTNLMSTGLLVGGEITANADPTKFDVSAGYGWVVNNYTDVLNPTRTWVYWSAQIGVSDSYLSGDKTVVVIDSTGTLIQRTTYLSNNEFPQYIALGALGHSGGNIVDVVNSPVAITDIIVQLRQFFHALGDFAISGVVVGPNGSNLNIDVSAGEVHSEGANFQIDSRVPNIKTVSAMTVANFVRAYRNASSVWTYVGPVTAVDPDYYDPGGGAGLTAVTANNWTVQKIFYLAKGDYIFIQYGQAQYATKALAEAAINDAFVVSPDLTDSIFRGSLVVQQGTTDLSDTNYAVFYPSTSKIGITSGGGGAGGGGETNTASNIGTAGVGVYAQKLGVDLQFKNIVAGSTKVTITDVPASHTISTDIVEGNIVHQNLSGAGTNTHAQIDTHIGSTSNPHAVTKTQVGLSNVTNDAQVKASDLPGVSVDGEITLFNGVSGESLKRAAITGIVKATAGVAAQAISGTDYEPPIAAGTTADYWRGDKTWQILPTAGGWPTRYKDGGKVSRNATNPTYQLDIAPCYARSDDDTTDLASSGTLTVDLTVSGVNGLDTGSEASSTWYHIWLVYNPTTTTYGGLISLSSTAPTMPSGYTRKKRLASWYNDASGNWRAKDQILIGGNEVEYAYEENENTVTNVLSGGTSTSWATVSLAVLVPPTSLIPRLWVLFKSLTAGERYVSIRANGSSTTAPTREIHGGYTSYAGTSVVDTLAKCNASQQIQYQNSASSTNSNIWVLGYREIL